MTWSWDKEQQAVKAWVASQTQAPSIIHELGRGERARPYSTDEQKRNKVKEYYLKNKEKIRSQQRRRKELLLKQENEHGNK